MLTNKRPEELRGFGRVITGSVKDCDKKTLERQLQFYDRFLYITWNSDKQGGRGCWEVRRRPEYTTAIYQGKQNGYKLYTTEYKESDLINHVLDVPILHYGILGKIKSMDVWHYKDFDRHLNDTAVEWKEKERIKVREEMRYDLQQHKREWRDYLSLVQSGMNPSQALKGIKG